MADTVIIGAGPAGLAAAEVLANRGARVAVIDELPTAGGQFLRPPPRNSRQANWLTGSAYQDAKSLLERVEVRDDIRWQLSTSVVGVFRDVPDEHTGDSKFTLWLDASGEVQRLEADRLLIATGCYERPFIFPGWTLPGVMGAGAIQTLLKSSGALTGERIAFAGSHPLQLIVASQILEAGGVVSAIAFSQPRSVILKSLKHSAALFPRWRLVLDALSAYRRIRRAGVPIYFGAVPAEAIGVGRVSRLRLARASDAEHTIAEIDADSIGLCYGFRLATELARYAGAKTRWSALNGGWQIDSDRWYRTSVAGLSIAGELAGQDGAEVAMLRGRIAAAGLLMDQAELDEESANRQTATDRRKLATAMRFAGAVNALAEPPEMLSEAAEEAVLCRCEGVSVQTLRDCIDQYPQLTTIDALKLVSRVGMGRCQGRMCGANAAAELAARRGIAVDRVGEFTSQAPTKPISIAALLEIAPEPADNG